MKLGRPRHSAASFSLRRAKLSDETRSLTEKVDFERIGGIGEFVTFMSGIKVDLRASGGQGKRHFEARASDKVGWAAREDASARVAAKDGSAELLASMPTQNDTGKGPFRRPGGSARAG